MNEMIVITRKMAVTHVPTIHCFFPSLEMGGPWTLAMLSITVVGVDRSLMIGLRVVMMEEYVMFVMVMLTEQKVKYRIWIDWKAADKGNWTSLEDREQITNI
jgi:hypothetical protein